MLFEYCEILYVLVYYQQKKYSATINVDHIQGNVSV